MKIARIETFLLRCTIPQGWKFPTASYVTGGSLFIKVTTDDGIHGWGEPSPYGGPIEITRGIVENELKAIFLGKDPKSVGSLTAQDELKGEHAYGRAAYSSAIAGMSQALWDILGKASGKPVFRLLNPTATARTSVKAYASGGMIYEDSPRSWLVDEALQAKEEGYTAWKFRPVTPRQAGSHFQRNLSPPSVDCQELAEIAAMIRDEVGSDFELMLDAGCRVAKLEDAILLAENLGRLDFSFFEEPVARALSFYQELVRRKTVPIAIGECFFSHGKFKEWADSGALDVFQPDANFCGMDESLAVGQLAHENGKSVVLHNWASAISIAANVHLAAAMPMCPMLEYNQTFNPLRTELVVAPYVPQNGSFRLSEKPGLGIEVNEEALRRYAFG